MLPHKPGLLIFCVAISVLHPSWTQKIQTTRTALHVARSLDPNSMESVPVRTRAGDLTTIIVKKRQGKSSNVTESDTNSTTTGTNYVLLSSSNSDTGATEAHQASNRVEQIIAIPYSEYNASHLVASANRTSESAQNRTDRSDQRVPDPVYVSSSTVFVKNELNSPNKKGRSLIKMDYDGIPVVTGVRVPDDDTDRQVWRNARVINGILVPYDKADKDIITKSKPGRKPSTTKPPDEGWTKIGVVNKKPTKLAPAVQIMKQESWNDPKWDLYKKPATLKPFEAPTSEPQVLQTIETNDMVDRMKPTYTQHPMGLWMPTDTDENPEHKYVTDRILEYIRNINKEEMKRLSLQKFTVRDARMLSTSSPSQEQPQIQSRILHAPGASIFPNSAKYSPSTQTPSRASFEEGIRTPVLQYAHPELGVQAVKAEPTHGDAMEKKGSSYFAEDIHADRGPFVFEPAAPAEQVETEASNQRSHTAAPSYFQRPKKTLAYFYPEKPVYPPNKYYGKYPSVKDDYKLSEYPTIYYEDMDGRPFWIRFGDSLKEQVQTSIDKVTDLTRPVVEPLVEATHKISQNLGFSSGNRDMSTIREKLGTVSTSSLILPAIGIVAGGAALGLGAVAVGRYLNYDVVKMRSGKSMNVDQLHIPDPTDSKHLESLWAEDKSRSAGEPTSTSTEAPTTTATKSRRRRSISKSQNSDIYLEHVLQTLDSNKKQSQVDVYPSSVWSNTPCSKKIFCEAMLLQPEDSIALMDKKIFTFLSLIHPDIAATVAPHLEDVMRAVKMKNCSTYACPSLKHSHMPEMPVNNT